MKKYCPQLADCDSCPDGVETDESYCGCCGLPLLTHPLTTDSQDERMVDARAESKPEKAVFHIRFPEETTHEQLIEFLTQLAELDAKSGLNVEIEEINE